MCRGCLSVLSEIREVRSARLCDTHTLGTHSYSVEQHWRLLSAHGSLRSWPARSMQEQAMLLAGSRLGRSLVVCTICSPATFSSQSALVFFRWQPLLPASST